MKHLKILCLSLFALYQFLLSDYRNTSGGQLLYFMSSPTVTGSGGGYATETEEMDALPLNPVIAAGNLYQSVNVSYLGTPGGAFNGYSLSYSLPRSIGVFSLTHTGLLTEDYGLGDFFNTQVLFSKVISTQFKFGFGLNIDYLESAREIPLGVSLDVSVLYEAKKTLKKGFGFGDLKVGGLIKHLGAPNIVTNSEGDEGWLRPTEIRVGAGFNLLKANYARTRYTLGLSSDLALAIYPVNFIANLAIKNRWDLPLNILPSVHLNIGTFLPSSSAAANPLGYPDLFPLTLGTALKINIAKTIVHVNYALMFERIDRSRWGSLHVISLNLEFGKKDFNKPTIRLDDVDEEELVDPKNKLPGF